jgi:hypothetical protein
VKYTHIRKSRRWFSVQRSQRGVAGTISLEIPGQASARSTSSALGSSLGLVSSAIMSFAKSSAVCSSELEKMVTELRQKWSGSTARPAVELAVRHQYVVAHSRVLGMPREIELALSRERGFCTPCRWPTFVRTSDDPRPSPTVSGPSRPKPTRASQTPQPVSPASLSRAAPLRPPRTIRTIVLEQGFEGARLNTGR